MKHFLKLKGLFIKICVFICIVYLISRIAFLKEERINLYPYAINMRNESTCSNLSTQRGPGQKVISYAFYGKSNSKYFEGIEIQLQKIQKYYPNWIMRLYYEINPNDIPTILEINRLSEKYKILDLCDVTNLPTLGNISDRFGMLWRFACLGDPLVERCMSRDLDSYIHQREVDAVNEWISSAKTLHVMRDHHYHSLPILGGMWGIYNYINPSLCKILRGKLLLPNTRNQLRGFDQYILGEILWPSIDDVIAHDSFFCNKFPKGFRPFPTRRENGIFIGGVRNETNDRKCDPKCRPPSHPDWEFC